MCGEAVSGLIVYAMVSYMGSGVGWCRFLRGVGYGVDRDVIWTIEIN